MVGLAACGDDDGNGGGAADTSRDADAEVSSDVADGGGDGGSDATGDGVGSGADGAGSDADAASDAAGDADVAAASVLVLSGTASGADPEADRRAECSFGALIDQIVPDGDGGFSAFASGEVFRNIYPDTRRYEFSALIAGEATLARGAGDTFELRFVGDQPEDAIPFWLALEVLTATPEGTGGWQGSWRCAPMDIDFGGFFDDGPTVDGTWTLVPQAAAGEPVTTP
jgi:hypothetical protein